MIELGVKDVELSGSLKLSVLSTYEMGYPTNIDFLQSNECLVCGYFDGNKETLFRCESMEDVVELYKGFEEEKTLRIFWYRGTDPALPVPEGGAMISLPLPERGESPTDLVEAIIETLPANMAGELKVFIREYSQGMPKIARLLKGLIKEDMHGVDFINLIKVAPRGFTVSKAIDLYCHLAGIDDSTHGEVSPHSYPQAVVVEKKGHNMRFVELVHQLLDRCISLTNKCAALTKERDALRREILVIKRQYKIVDILCDDVEVYFAENPATL